MEKTVKQGMASEYEVKCTMNINHVCNSFNTRTSCVATFENILDFDTIALTSLINTFVTNLPIYLGIVVCNV